jgi:hypothetical protein
MVAGEVQGSNNKTFSVTLSAFQRQQEKSPSFGHDDIAALPTFLLYIMLLPMPLEMGKCKSDAVKYRKLAVFYRKSELVSVQNGLQSKFK